MTRMIALTALLAISSLALASSTPLTCHGTVGDSYYDFSALGETEIQGKSSMNNYNFYLRMCGAAVGQSNQCNGLNAILCQVYIATNLVQPANAYNDDTTGQPVWALLPGKTEADGVQLTVLGSSAGGCASARKTIFQVTCSESVVDPPTTFVAYENPTCTQTIQISHAVGCPTTPGGDDGSSDDGISGGTIFLIILLCVVFIYIAGGCFYKRYKLGTTGMMESCPNNGFWSDFPGLVKDGCIYVYHKCRSLCGSKPASSSSSSYETI